MRFSTALVCTSLCVLLSACSSAEPAAQPASDAALEPADAALEQVDPELPDASSEESAACTIDTCTFAAPELWSKPVADYIQAASDGLQVDSMELHRSIDDLMVFEDRLYFGYGDATLNAGRVVDIQVRYFSETGGPQPLVDFEKTTEEELEHYRRFGDSLYIPGVDATEDQFLGNVFVRPQGGSWTRQRSVQGGVHVHDVAVFGSELYACGSGALDLETWNQGMVHSFLWRSHDQGQSWQAVAEVANDQIGDRRWVQLVPFPQRLLVFGYSTDAKGSIVKLLSNAWDGTQMTDTAIGSKHFVLSSEVMDATTAVLRVVKVTAPLQFQLLKVAADGTTGAVVAALSGKTVLDIHVFEPGKAVLVVSETDAYPLPYNTTPWHVLYTSDWSSFRELTTGSTTYWPTAVAYWKGGLYVGTENGLVYRSVPVD